MIRNLWFRHNTGWNGRAEVYSLKTIRRIRGLEGAGVTASIYRDSARIGWVQLPADGGDALFTFDIESERAGLQQYVELWWQTAQARVASAPATAEFSSTHPALIPPLCVKLKYWVTSLVREESAEKKIKTLA